MFKNILYSDSDYTRVQARVGPIISAADVTAAKALLAGFKGRCGCVCVCMCVYA